MFFRADVSSQQGFWGSEGRTKKQGSRRRADEAEEAWQAQSIPATEGKRQIKRLQRNYRGPRTCPCLTISVTSPCQTPARSKRTEKQPSRQTSPIEPHSTKGGDERAKNSLQFTQLMQRRAFTKAHLQFGEMADRNASAEKWRAVILCRRKKKYREEEKKRIKIMLSWFMTNRCLYWFPFYWSGPSFSVVNILTYFW